MRKPEGGSIGGIIIGSSAENSDGIAELFIKNRYFFAVYETSFTPAGAEKFPSERIVYDPDLYDLVNSHGDGCTAVHLSVDEIGRAVYRVDDKTYAFADFFGIGYNMPAVKGSVFFTEKACFGNQGMEFFHEHVLYLKIFWCDQVAPAGLFLYLYIRAVQNYTSGVFCEFFDFFKKLIHIIWNSHVVLLCIHVSFADRPCPGLPALIISFIDTDSVCSTLYQNNGFFAWKQGADSFVVIFIHKQV